MPTAFDAIRGVLNPCQVLPNLTTGGQPAPAHLDALAAAGVTVILDVRAPNEPRGFGEQAVVERLGLQYVNIPVGPTPLDDRLMERILTVLREHAGDQVFWHCGSGNRVGGPLLAHLMLDHGMDEDDALAMAQRAGLQSPQLASWGLDYVRRHRREG